MSSRSNSKPQRILLLPYPRQGHINPMLQFAKTLSPFTNISTTLITTTSISSSLHLSTTAANSVADVQCISDGYSDIASREAAGFSTSYSQLCTLGPVSLSNLLSKLTGDCRCSLIYDSMLPWARGVAAEHGVAAAAFLTQPCAVNIVYYCVARGWLELPLTGEVRLPEVLPEMTAADLPSFVAAPEYSPAHVQLVLTQFEGIEMADWVLCNTVEDLEKKEINWLSKFFQVRAIGPMIPSQYLLYQPKGDTTYGADLFNSEESNSLCLDWLDLKEASSVIYVSFGSLTKLSRNQMKELAYALIEINYNFIWVVRESEKKLLDEIFTIDTLTKSSRNLIVPWCSQLEVLSHAAVGCFVTHCGWNSILEALALGKPMVAMPQWTDQPTNAKYIEDVWGVGVKARVRVSDGDEQGIVGREEIERCVKEIMESSKGDKCRKNARVWSDVVKNAVGEGGSSSKNINDFVVDLFNI